MKETRDYAKVADISSEISLAGLDGITIAQASGSSVDWGGSGTTRPTNNNFV